MRASEPAFGVCVGVYLEVSEVHDDGYAVVRVDAVPKEHENAVRTVVNQRPSRAISSATTTSSQARPCPPNCIRRTRPAQNASRSDEPRLAYQSNFSFSSPDSSAPAAQMPTLQDC